MSQPVLLPLEVARQPDDVTCGPTCLHAVYRYFNLDEQLQTLIHELPALADGSRLGVTLGLHALNRGFRATLYTYNLHIFDPTWFPNAAPSRPSQPREQPQTQTPPPGSPALLSQKLTEQLEAKRARDPLLHTATAGYLQFLHAGGEVRLQDFTSALIARTLRRGLPILTVLTSTYLYRCEREWGPNDDPDDIQGEPSGHWVIIHGFNPVTRSVTIADPVRDNPAFSSTRYEVSISRLVTAVLLGVLTYDSNLLVLEPAAPSPDSSPDPSPDPSRDPNR